MSCFCTVICSDVYVAVVRGRRVSLGLATAERHVLSESIKYNVYQQHTGHTVYIDRRAEELYSLKNHVRRGFDIDPYLDLKPIKGDYDMRNPIPHRYAMITATAYQLSTVVYDTNMTWTTIYKKWDRLDWILTKIDQFDFTQRRDEYIFLLETEIGRSMCRYEIGCSYMWQWIVYTDEQLNVKYWQSSETKTQVAIIEMMHECSFFKHDPSKDYYTWMNALL